MRLSKNNVFICFVQQANMSSKPTAKRVQPVGNELPINLSTGQPVDVNPNPSKKKLTLQSIPATDSNEIAMNVAKYLSENYPKMGIAYSGQALKALLESTNTHNGKYYLWATQNRIVASVLKGIELLFKFEQMNFDPSNLISVIMGFLVSPMNALNDNNLMNVINGKIVSLLQQPSIKQEINVHKLIIISLIQATAEDIGMCIYLFIIYE